MDLLGEVQYISSDDAIDRRLLIGCVTCANYTLHKLCTVPYTSLDMRCSA